MTTESKRLSLDDFKKIVQNAPLFAIDLVVINQQNEVLLGQRLNAPAKGFWFVPGGRVHKNESLELAFERISFDELGFLIERNKTSLLGIFDHFYVESFFSDRVSTHYINATHVIHLDKAQLDLPLEQHSQYRWVAIDFLEEDEKVHEYSKVFLPALLNWLKRFKKTDD